MNGWQYTAVILGAVTAGTILSIAGHDNTATLIISGVGMGVFALLKPSNTHTPKTNGKD